jgi:hypothetical protein
MQTMTTIYSKLKQYSLYAAMLGSLAACRKEFQKINTDPEELASVTPEGQFIYAEVQMNSGDFEQYYDNYRWIMPFTELTVNNGGNSQTFATDNIGNTNQRFGYYYSRVGNNLANVIHLIDQMADADKAARANEKAIAQILNVYYAWYTSDINGSMPYSEAFQARYTGNFTPVYDKQQDLFPLWDSQLKAAVGVLTGAPAVTQVSYGSNDQYYKGDPIKWAKFANSLRLKIASRLSKVQPDTYKSIATEVLNDATGTFASTDDDMVFVAGNTFTGGGNWNPVTIHSSKSMVDFMLANADPRLRNYYQKNDYSAANVATAVAQGVLPAGTVAGNQYVGAYSSPDAVATHPTMFKTRQIKDANGNNIQLDTVSLIQYRMWQAEYTYNNAVGSGSTTLPVLTYADICFLKAELAALNIAGSDAEGWYYKGVEASIKRYDIMAATAKLPDYVAVTQQEVTNYEASAGVKFDASNAMALIASQSFINDYKIPNEAWATIKRLGMPNSTTPLALEPMTVNGTPFVMPRRASIQVLPETDLNQKNNLAAIADMETNPDFGNGPSDVTGRVWWDKK